MKKFVIALLILGFSVLCIGINNSHAGEIDLLLEKLVEKGILTPGEASVIKVETQEEMKKEIVEGKNNVLPMWLQTMKFKGDFRLRYQYNHGKTVADQTNERHRGRFRLRLGVESKVNEKLKVAFGLATGLTDQSSDSIRSTNQSFDDTFMKKPINLDYAYATYAPFSWVTLIGGKMKLDPIIWEPGDLMWDTDITPEGVGGIVTHSLSSNHKLSLASGFYVLEEDNPSGGSGDDPWLFHFQPVIVSKLTDKASLKTGLTLDYFAVGGTTLHGSAGNSSNTWGSSPIKDVVNIMPAVQLTLNKPFESLGISFLDIPQLSFFGEYVNNLNDSKPDDNKSGFMLGVKFGAEKISGWGDWQAGYNYAMLGRDAVLDELPDSDRYSGRTGIRAHELKFTYGLSKNTSLDLDMYRSKRIGMTSAPETVVQCDWNMKF